MLWCMPARLRRRNALLAFARAFKPDTPGISRRVAALPCGIELEEREFEIRMRRDLAMLQSLDDAMLHDIGLSRGEVEHVVRHGRPLAPWAEWR